jgi:hypothetical protein
MLLCQPLVEVLAGRGIENIDAFIKAPSWSDLPSPFSIQSMDKAVDRVLRAVVEKERISIFGDYDCDGVLGTHVLCSVLGRFGAIPRAYLPHRDEGYGLSTPAVHLFSRSGTDLLITVDNGINAQGAVLLAQRLGIDVVVVDHHRIQEQAKTLAVWSLEFCGAGLATMFAWALAARAGWDDTRLERLLEGCSQYAAIASIADCVPLLNGTRTLARVGLGACTGKTLRAAGAAQGFLHRSSKTRLTRRGLRDCSADQRRGADGPSGLGVGRLRGCPGRRGSAEEGRYAEPVESRTPAHREAPVRGAGCVRCRASPCSAGDLPGDLSQRDRRPLGEQVRRTLLRSQHRACSVHRPRPGSWIGQKCCGLRPGRRAAPFREILHPIRRARSGSGTHDAPRSDRGLRAGIRALRGENGR